MATGPSLAPSTAASASTGSATEPTIGIWRDEVLLSKKLALAMIFPKHFQTKILRRHLPPNWIVDMPMTQMMGPIVAPRPEEHFWRAMPIYVPAWWMRSGPSTSALVSIKGHPISIALVLLCVYHKYTAEILQQVSMMETILLIIEVCTKNCW